MSILTLVTPPPPLTSVTLVIPLFSSHICHPRCPPHPTSPPLPFSRPFRDACSTRFGGLGRPAPSVSWPLPGPLFLIRCLQPAGGVCTGRDVAVVIGLAQRGKEGKEMEANQGKAKQSKAKGKEGREAKRSKGKESLCNGKMLLQWTHLSCSHPIRNNSTKNDAALCQKLLKWIECWNTGWTWTLPSPITWCSDNLIDVLHLQYKVRQIYYILETIYKHEVCSCRTVHYSTVQYSTVQYSTVQYSTVQYSTVQNVRYSKGMEPEFAAAASFWHIRSYNRSCFLHLC